MSEHIEIEKTRGQDPYGHTLQWTLCGSDTCNIDPNHRGLKEAWLCPTCDFEICVECMEEWKKKPPEVSEDKCSKCY